MKIAIIGSGISGLIAALLLQEKHDVTIFEAESWVGGHVHTIPVPENGKTIMVDTGFIVCNDRNYPNFTKLLKKLDVPLQETLMSFSVATADGSLEYNGTNINGIFAQRKNLISRKFWHLLGDIYKFNNSASKFILTNNTEISFGSFINNLNLSYACKAYYLHPMIAAIWSSKISVASKMPAMFLCKFFDNHGLLSIKNRPQWYTIAGGSQVYVDKIVTQLKNKPIINSPVYSIKRSKEYVEVSIKNDIFNFDKVIIATHSDQALKLLTDPSDLEKITLEKILYQKNEVTLHTDINLMPKSKRAWASWNYYVDPQQDKECVVTYYMNMLQKLNSEKTYIVSLNQDHRIDPSKIIGKYSYAHPIFDQKAIDSQANFSMISGVNKTYYCGAYWGNGFHEAGMNSGLRVVEQIDKELFCAAQYTLD